MNMETQVPASLSARLSSLRATNELLPNLRPHPTPWTSEAGRWEESLLTT